MLLDKRKILSYPTLFLLGLEEKQKPGQTFPKLARAWPAPVWLTGPRDGYSNGTSCGPPFSQEDQAPDQEARGSPGKQEAGDSRRLK